MSEIPDKIGHNYRLTDILVLCMAVLALFYLGLSRGIVSHIYLLFILNALQYTTLVFGFLYRREITQLTDTKYSPLLQLYYSTFTIS